MRDGLRRDDVSLVTLTGPGGVGKTRLALQVAAGEASAFADGVCFVELGPVRDPDLVLPTVAHALDFGDKGHWPLIDQLAAHLRPRDRAPLLFIAGGEDHIMRGAVNRTNADKYRDARAVTDYKEFSGRSHYTLDQDGWEEVADFALAWAVEHALPRAAAAGPTVDTEPIVTAR